MHTQFSGFGFPDTLDQLEQVSTINAWDETPWVFDNLYYSSVAAEPWMNIVNTVKTNAIPNLGGTTNSLPAGSIPDNTGTNFWSVQDAKGVFLTAPACSEAGLGVPGSPPRKYT